MNQRMTCLNGQVGKRSSCLNGRVDCRFDKLTIELSQGSICLTGRVVLNPVGKQLSGLNTLTTLDALVHKPSMGLVFSK